MRAGCSPERLGSCQVRAHSASGCGQGLLLDKNLETRPAQLQAEAVVRKRREALPLTGGLLSPFLRDANCTPITCSEARIPSTLLAVLFVWPRVGVLHAL